MMTTLAAPVGGAVARWRVPVAAAVLAVGAATALLVRDPHVPGSWGECPVHAATGLYCPGCGALRACNDLLSGHVGAAIGSNVLVPLALGWLAWWWLARVGAAAGRRVPAEPSGQVFTVALVVLITVFTVARNLPGSPLAP